MKGSHHVDPPSLTGAHEGVAGGARLERFMVAFIAERDLPLMAFVIKGNTLCPTSLDLHQDLVLLIPEEPREACHLEGSPLFPLPVTSHTLVRPRLLMILLPLHMAVQALGMGDLAEGPPGLLILGSVAIPAG
jgi:hypothetical protein